jgi:hypothetical protein
LKKLIIVTQHPPEDLNSFAQITELPPGRAQTVTQAFHGNAKGRRDAYKVVFLHNNSSLVNSSEHHRTSIQPPKGQRS